MSKSLQERRELFVDAFFSEVCTLYGASSIRRLEDSCHLFLPAKGVTIISLMAVSHSPFAFIK